METFRSSVFRAGKLADKASGCLIIGEVAQAHDGSLGTAHAFIDAIADAGADAVKFQTHLAGAESTPAEPWRIKFSQQDASRYDYWKRMEFSEDHWHGLKKHANDRNLLFLSSPFSFEAVQLLRRVGVSAWKIASGEISNEPMFDRMKEDDLPFIISTGMSNWEEIDRVVGSLMKSDCVFALLQCTSAYPCPPEKIGINILNNYRDRYGCPVGLSDHSASIFPGIAAASCGAEVVEVHVTLSHEMFGPDVVASLTTREFKQLVDGVRYIDCMLNHPIDKDNMAKSLHPTRELFTKSIVAVERLQSGTILRTEHLACKKPGTGLSPENLSEIIGKKLTRNLNKDELLRDGDWN
jgi:N,N'-diacetyllegionaminate synthase